ncbi:MAG: multidrug effflux MFS transporter [Acidimicrobiia bacterium]|nr:multidrug effflux MFS transporter [Acidimicrobiia bacterium]
MNRQDQRQRGSIGPRELIALLSLTMALTAISIDMMLPAFGEMRASFGMDPDSPRISATITALFIGLASAQILYGPLSDRFGRRPVLFAGFGLYAVGAAGAALAPTFGLLLASRFLWGTGAAGARVVSLAIVRDSYRGDQMARIMSLLMAVFITVPVLAPSIGAGIITFLPWRAIFWFCVAYATVVAIWAVLRLPETLDPASRIPLRFDRVARTARTVLSQRAAMAHAVAMTLLFGVFSSYLGSSQIIIDDVFGLSARFPLIFSGMAVLMGVAALGNASIVERFGARRIVGVVLSGYVVAAGALVAVSMAGHGRPGFWPFTLVLALLLFSNALLTPNLSTLAMEPMGEMAGTASALIGTAQIGGGALIGSFIDGAYDGTVTPLAIAFLVMGVLAWLVVRWAPAD